MTYLGKFGLKLSGNGAVADTGPVGAKIKPRILADFFLEVQAFASSRPALAGGWRTPGHNAWQIHGVPMSDNIPVLTIDGPSGAGKGTVSRIAAARLGWHYLDSGALYRAVGVAASWANLDISDPAALVRCTFDTAVSFKEDPKGDLRVWVNGSDATDELRLETTGAVA